ncbi:angiopoietin-related protein 1-like [Zophobas morio]|uniref:angiopoietin-related protein 1-like n=1 Tax=Zophobas morio TaxID=2755281 RepID=UPI003083546B
MQAQFTEAKTEISQLQDLNEVKNQLAKTQEKILTEIQDCKSVPRDCREVQKRGYNTSGIFRIQPMLSLQSFLVWCDLSTREGGWTYVVNRFDGSQNFYLNWTDYKQGFGNLSGEYWLGLDHLYELTNSKRTELLFELVDWDLKKVYALYDDFQIGNEFEMYRVKTLGKYTGDAGNSFYPHQNANFSTADNEHSETCAAYFEAGWWYVDCHAGCVTCKYQRDLDEARTHRPFSGIKWNSFHGFNYSLKEARMLIRPRLGYVPI